MKIFPKSSTLTDLVNYVNNRTVSHQKVFDFFKNLVLSPGENASITVNFTEKDKYFNSQYPVDESGYILRPQDMFGGKYLPNNPIITSFDTYPKTKTVPNIIEGKPEQSVKINNTLHNEISLTSPTISGLSNSGFENLQKIKYWPTLKISDFYPISQGLSDKEQDNLNGYSVSDTVFSIINAVGDGYRYHHLDIEYSVNEPKMVIFVLLDGNKIKDGETIDFKISLKNIDNTKELNKWPLILFVDSTYLNISIENTYLNSALSSDTQSLVIDGITYEYIPAFDFDKHQYKYLRLPIEDSLGYLKSVDDVNQIFENDYGTKNLIKFDGNSNSIKYTDYGYLNNEQLMIDNNSLLTLVTRPILGKASDNLLENSSVVFSKDSIKLITRNNSCAVFGANTNKYTYDLSTYSTGSSLESKKVVTDYLPIDYPRQLKLNLVKFTEAINSGLFYSFDITSDQVGNNYYILKSGLQFINTLSFSIRKHSTSILVEYSGNTYTVNTSLTNLSVDFGFKRLKNTIHKKVLIRSGGSVLYTSGWVADLEISEYNCDILSKTSPYIEIWSVSDLNTTHSTNTIAVSNILIYSDLERSEVDSLFEVSTLNGDSVRFNNKLSTTPKIIPISQLEGLLKVVSQYPVSNVMMYNLNEDNASYGSVEYRLGFTAHENKGRFNYRPRGILSVDNSKFISNSLVIENICGNFSQYAKSVDIDCSGILTVEKLSYFNDVEVPNRLGSKVAKKYNSKKILNKKTLISFNRCGYSTNVKSTTSYDYFTGQFTFDSGRLASWNKAWKKIQSFNIKTKVLSQNAGNVSNTINRILYYMDSQQVLSNPDSNLPQIFNSNYGDSVDIFGLLSDPLSKYKINGFKLPFQLTVPTANDSNYTTYDNTIWELRYIKTNINHNTVQFGDINLSTDTVVVAETSVNVVKSEVFGTYDFFLEFSYPYTISSINIPIEYLKNGFLLTLKSETINTDGNALNWYGASTWNDGGIHYPYIDMQLTTSKPVVDNNYEYVQLPDVPKPTLTLGKQETPNIFTKYKALSSEYIDEYNDIPTINRWILSTFYQIPKYSK